MRTRFLLVRHATCARIEEVLLGRTLDLPLDANGRLQAHALAERLRREAPLRVECSPRRRTVETARAIAAAARCQLRIARPLDELDFGDWCGRTFTELQDDPGWRRWNEDRGHASTPAGVDIRGVQHRLRRHLSALAARFAGATLVLVTHAEIIRSLVLYCSGAGAGDYRQVAVAPASVTRMCLDPEQGLRLEAPDEPAPDRRPETAIATENVP